MVEDPADQFDEDSRPNFEPLGDLFEGDILEEPVLESGEESISLANTNDQASREDWLGFAPYVTAIADFLTSKDTKPPLVMSVEGEWGSGKTSFMRQLEHALRVERKQKFTVWFNPWRHDSEDAVWAAFALQFVRSIAKSQWFGRRWLGHFRLFIRRFRWEEGWLDLSRKILLWLLILAVTVGIGVYGFVTHGTWTQQLDLLAQELTALEDLQSLIINGLSAGGVVAYIFLWLTVLNKLTTFIGDPLKIDLKKYIDAPNYEERVSFVERFHEDFQHVVEAYAGKGTVFVFIDDVDRCEVPKAADLMSAINLMISGDTRLVFIIGMDREKVAAGLAVKHEKLLPFLHVSRYDSMDEQDKENRIRLMGLEFGYEFIEKFVQLPFIVPRPDDTTLGDFLKMISGDKEQAIQTPAIAPSRLRSILTGTPLPPPARPSANVKSPSQRKRRESIKIQAGTDSDRIHNIIRVVAPAFENNPRRLKQFINLFRLRVFIASETGLFDYKRTKDSYVSLTLEQLGKFVAINLRWPLLLADMEYAPNLLNDLQKLSFDMKAEVTTQASRLSRWRHRPDLLSFLAAGMPSFSVNALGIDRTESRWSLENVDFAAIMRVSPRVRRVNEEKVIGRQGQVTLKSVVTPNETGELITKVESTYQFGDDLYDDSFSIDTSSGKYLGEMGVAIKENLGINSPKKVIAFEVWLFDVNDIKSNTKILISEFGFNDPMLRVKLEPSGELVQAMPNGVFVVETVTLYVVASLIEMKYFSSTSSPDNSCFERIKIEMAAFQKPQKNLEYKE